MFLGVLFVSCSDDSKKDTKEEVKQEFEHEFSGTPDTTLRLLRSTDMKPYILLDRCEVIGAWKGKDLNSGIEEEVIKVLYKEGKWTYHLWTVMYEQFWDRHNGTMQFVNDTMYKLSYFYEEEYLDDTIHFYFNSNNQLIEEFEGREMFVGDKFDSGLVEEWRSKNMTDTVEYFYLSSGGHRVSDFKLLSDNDERPTLYNTIPILIEYNIEEFNVKMEGKYLDYMTTDREIKEEVIIVQ